MMNGQNMQCKKRKWNWRIRDGNLFKHRKLAQRIFLSMFVILYVGLILPYSLITSNAASYASKFAWRDENGNIILKTEDHQRTSEVCYMTVGWTVTRCVLGTMEGIEDQYVTIMYNDDLSLQDVPIGNGFTTSAFVVSEADFLSKIASSSGDWLADLQSKKTCYIRFDAIMITCDYSLPELQRYSGYMLSDNNQDYQKNPLNPIPGIYDKFTKDLLKSNTYAWASPESIETHFNIYLLYNGGEEEEPVRTDEFITSTGKSKPEYYTWNTSDEFDLSKGIPSGEDITNGYGADKWYGNMSIGKHEVEKSYVISYDFKYHVYTQKYKTDGKGNYLLDEAGNKIPDGVEDNIHYVPYSFTVTRKASYYYAMALNLYELKEVDVANSVYPDDLIKYLLSGTEVDMKTELDGEKNPSSVADWTSDEDKHIIWPEEYTDTVEIDCGEGPGSVGIMLAKLNTVLYDDEITDDDVIKGVTSWNDLVEVNGVKYLDNEHVTHANDTSKVRKEYKLMPSGKDDATYLFHEQQKTVTIPTNVANGSYATSLDVLYKKRVLDDNSTMAFSSMTDGINAHLKPGYEKNEPVFVHTPVISPVSIIDSEDTTQLITEHKTEYAGMVDKDGRVPDNQAIYELILDNEYTFKFDPALHREIQGYGWSEDPSKYDKYVKGKYVAFPFTAQVEIDGEYSDFYVPDDSTVDDEGNEKLAGYTKWIEVPNNETSFYIPAWAIESSYYEIRYRVEAYNVEDENGEDHSDDEEGTANEELNEEGEAINYVATYSVPIELSGIIYNFEIIGTNYYEDYNDELESGVLAFSPRKSEKKQGNRNRLGGTSVRYTLDGEITTAWEEENTLPMAMGTSDVWSARGYLVGGNTITFSVKTIANLWDEEGDSIYIRPSFRWFEADGTEHSDLQVYYWDDTNSNQLIRYGSDEDLAEMTAVEDDGGNNEFSMWTSTLAGSAWDRPYSLNKDDVQWLSSDIEDYTAAWCLANGATFYHSEDLIYTLDWHNRNASVSNRWQLGQLLGQKSRSYCLSAIELNSKMRLLTGNYEELARNVNKDRNNLETFSLDDETEDKLKYSMQTWYGAYTIPDNMLICDADTFEKLGATDKNGDGEVDYWDYLVCTDKTVDKNADFWLNNKGVPYGYLMLNFNIITINDGTPHLSYYGGTRDMWKVQGSKTKAPIGNPVIEVPIKSGDIAIVNPDQSMYDRYEPGILMIN